MLHFKHLKAALFACLISIAAIVQANADVIHHWDFNNDLSDQNGGPDAIITGGSLGPSGYTFDSQGYVTLSLGGIIPADHYDIEIRFSLDANNIGYQKIIDFSNLVDDEGMYAYDNYFYFYDESPDLDNFTFLPDEMMTLRVMRDGASDKFTAYLNGNLLWDFVDSSNLAVLTGSNMHFFVDDQDTSGREKATGFVDYIKLHGTAQIPEPEILGLMLIGLIGIRLTRRRK